MLKNHLQEFEGQKIGFLRPHGRVDMIAVRWGDCQNITLKEAIEMLLHPTPDLFLLWEIVPSHATFYETEKNKHSWIIAYESNKYWLVQSFGSIPLTRSCLTLDDIHTFCAIISDYPQWELIRSLQRFLKLEKEWKFCFQEYELKISNVVRPLPSKL